MGLFSRTPDLSIEIERLSRENNALEEENAALKRENAAFRSQLIKSRGSLYKNPDSIERAGANSVIRNSIQDIDSLAKKYSFERVGVFLDSLDVADILKRNAIETAKRICAAVADDYKRCRTESYVQIPECVIWEDDLIPKVCGFFNISVDKIPSELSATISRHGYISKYGYHNEVTRQYYCIPLFNKEAIFDKNRYATSYSVFINNNGLLFMSFLQEILSKEPVVINIKVPEYDPLIGINGFFYSLVSGKVRLSNLGTAIKPRGLCSENDIIDPILCCSLNLAQEEK